jgi:hypothetical protein
MIADPDQHFESDLTQKRDGLGSRSSDTIALYVVGIGCHDRRLWYFQ